MADERNDAQNGNGLESNAARRLRLLGGSEGGDPSGDASDDGAVKVNKLANFWEYNRTKIIIISVFAVLLGILLAQLISRQNPDISIIYAGPDYITPNESKAFTSVVSGMVGDLNGDGKALVMLEDLVFMSDGQIADYLESAQYDDEAAAVDGMNNRETRDRFMYEIFAGDAMLCILAEDQYRMVEEGGGFMRLEDVLGYTPEGAIDEYGVRFAETKFCKFYDSAKIFPADAVIALRTLPTSSKLTGKKRLEKLHEYHTEAFRKIVMFDYPEGYVAD